jgi:hypothetical protein
MFARSRIWIAAIAVLLAAPASAGGSVHWSDIEPLFAQHPTLRGFIEATLEVNPHGVAERFGSHQPHLGGARIGPYRFQAHRKGSTTDALVLTVCTVPTFFDAHGDKTTWELAFSFTERMHFIALTDKNAPGPACIDWVDPQEPVSTSTQH